MPGANLDVDWRRFCEQSSSLQNLLSSIQPLSPAHRKLVAEIAMVRLFLLVENSISSIGAKLLCGADYLDGTRPARLVATVSISAATAAMKTHGRAQPKTYLLWTISRDIRQNLSHTLHNSDPFFLTVANNAALMTDMRYVRNHIAHGNSASRANFRNVIRKHYGGLKRGVTPGLLLLTNAFGVPCILDRYIVSSRIMIKDLVRG